MFEITRDGSLDALKVAELDMPRLLSEREAWHGMDITYNKPHIRRAWREWGQGRVYVHWIDGCFKEEAYMHPHPWPSAIRILEGKYTMRLGFKRDDKVEVISTQEFIKGSAYEMTNPLGWHSIQPQSGSFVLSLMVTGTPFDPSPEKPCKREYPALTKYELDEMLWMASRYYKCPYGKYPQPPVPVYPESSMGPQFSGQKNSAEMAKESEIKK